MRHFLQHLLLLLFGLELLLLFGQLGLILFPFLLHLVYELLSILVLLLHLSGHASTTYSFSLFQLLLQLSDQLLLRVFVDFGLIFNSLDRPSISESGECLIVVDVGW